MRYVVLGAGAIGGAIGGLLHRLGREVVLVARGEHLRALQRSGLRLLTPDSDDTVRVTAVADAAGASLRSGDTVILATKTQDTETVLRALATAAPPGITVVCAQNGVENERLALRRFAHVLGMHVVVAAAHLEPGVVEVSLAPVHGVLDVGVYPRGVDAAVQSIVEDLNAAGFDARADADVMRWKHDKLLGNLGNALEASLGNGELPKDLLSRAKEEGRACYSALGISVPSREEKAERFSRLTPLRPIGGASRRGGSTWQSLAKGSDSVETDYLNGEIVLMGRLSGVATPLNEALQRVMQRMSRDQLAPGSLTEDDIERELALVAAESRTHV